MTGPRTVPALAVGPVTVTAAGPITHRCPHVEERDDGTITLTWTTAGATIELHSLAAYLATWADQKISHEDLVVTIRDTLTRLGGIDDVTVAARFTTAGLAVEVTA